MMIAWRGVLAGVIACTAVLGLARPVSGQVLDASTRARADAIAERAIMYLKSEQDAATGGWRVNPEGPDLPAITGLVLMGMLDDPSVTPVDPDVARGVEYLMGFAQDDGGIYDAILPSYNTAITVSVLARMGREDTAALIPPAQEFLFGLQFGPEAIEEGPASETTRRVDESHPFFGGIGYGRSGRPDNSNLHFFMTAMQDSGVDCNDPAIQRAMTFLARTQMLGAVNDMPYAKGSTQGGFIYATGDSTANAGKGESKAGMIEETLSDGTVASRFRAYGSMTYAGFKSFAYAELDRDDPRVAAARDWIERNYTLEENPGIGMDGYYYYLMTFAKGLNAWGEPEIAGNDWRADLIAQLEELQAQDGSFRPVDDRWMEGDPVLITAYSLIALQHARR
ncbi:MAG: hypothetical protein AAGG07_09700 [Planctomycetota bacterium]